MPEEKDETEDLEYIISYEDGPEYEDVTEGESFAQAFLIQTDVAVDDEIIATRRTIGVISPHVKGPMRDMHTKIDPEKVEMTATPPWLKALYPATHWEPLGPQIPAKIIQQIYEKVPKLDVQNPDEVKQAINGAMNNFFVLVCRRARQLRFLGIQPADLVTTPVYDAATIALMQNPDLNPSKKQPSAHMSKNTWVDFLADIDTAIMMRGLFFEEALKIANPAEANFYLFPVFVALIEKGYEISELWS